MVGGIYASTNKTDDTATADEKNDKALASSGDEATTLEDIVKDSKVTTNNSATKSETMTKVGSYESYAPEKIAQAGSSHDVVLFFRASWCPTCRALDVDIKANLSKIPESLTILDVDYDNSSALKQKYSVTYQHTFVEVDKDGNMIKKWSGSRTLNALISELK